MNELFLAFEANRTQLVGWSCYAVTASGMGESAQRRYIGKTLARGVKALSFDHD